VSETDASGALSRSFGAVVTTTTGVGTRPLSPLSRVLTSSFAFHSHRHRCHSHRCPRNRHHRRATTIFEAILGLEHPQTAVGYNNLGSACRGSGELAKALEWHGKALAIRKGALGAVHEHTVESLMNIGNCLLQREDYIAALEKYTQCVSALELLYGKDHQKTAMGYDNVALVYLNTGQPAKALPEQLKALSAMTKIYGTVNVSTAPFHLNISTTLPPWRSGPGEGARTPGVRRIRADAWAGEPPDDPVFRKPRPHLFPRRRS